MNESKLLKSLIREVKELRKEVKRLSKLIIENNGTKKYSNSTDHYIENNEVDSLDGSEKLEKLEQLMKKSGYIFKIYETNTKKDKDTGEIKPIRGKYIASRSTPITLKTIAKLIKNKVLRNKNEDEYYIQVVKTIRDEETGDLTQRKVLRLIFPLDPNYDDS
jgi:hypothetical protein